ncbi:MAG: kdpC [Myxococcales bacterium]|nr:kdpC [Myxococcales bacterium]
MRDQLRTAVLALLVFTVICGFVYPLVVMAVAKLGFSHQANGSLITRGDVVIGSSLIGQPFSDPGYFWSRPSATTPEPYDATSSAADNLGPTNPALKDAVAKRVAALRATGTSDALVPVDLVTTSASGLDPDISPAAAYYQVPRVAKARGLAVGFVKQLVDRHVSGRLFGVFGDPHVNVLELNLELQTLVAKGG